MGELNWLDNNLLLGGMIPILLGSGIPEAEVDTLVGNAYKDLNSPIPVKLQTRIHVNHAFKKVSP